MLKSIHVGVGGRGATHVDVYSASAHFQPVGLVDVSPDALAAARAKTGLGEDACFGSVEDALARIDADVVVVSTPAAMHAGHVEPALRAGRHVFVEKPFTVSYEDAARLVALAEAKGVCLMVGQNDRYTDFNRAIKQIVDSGEFGELGFCQLTYYKARKGPFAYSPHMNLWQQGVHQIDTLISVVGQPVVEVFGTSFNPPWCDWPSESTDSAQVLFEGGVHATYLSSCNARAVELTFRLELRDGALEYARFGKRLVLARGRERREIEVAAGKPPEVQLSELFYRYVAHGEEPPVSGRNNLPTIRVIDAILESSRLRRSVQFAPGERPVSVSA